MLVKDKLPFAPGTLVVKVVSAALKSDEDLIGKMDPYVSLEYTGQPLQRTKVAESGGETSVWNETFKYPITKVQDLKNTLKLAIMDEDLFSKEDLGHETFHLGLLYNNGREFTANLHIFSGKNN